MRRFLALSILAFVPVLSARSAETADNPAYLSWAAHKPGATVVHKSITEAKGRFVETTTRRKLKSVNEKRVVIEESIVSDATGEKVEAPATEYELKRLMFLLPGVKKEDVGKPVGVVEQGEETLKLVGREFRATWYVTKGKTEAGESITRTWISRDVPGNVLKLVTKVPAGGKTTTVELIEFQTP